MGCGASKSAQVVNTAISTHSHPPSNKLPPLEPRNSVVNSISATDRRLSSVDVLPEINSNMKTQSVSSVTSKKSDKESTEQIEQNNSSEKEIWHEEFANQSKESSKPLEGHNKNSSEEFVEQPKQINTSSFGNMNLNSSEKKVEDKEFVDSHKFSAFEVDMSIEGSKNAPKKPPPISLTKMDSLPKVTYEMLEEKQRVVKERKDKELEKRANSRVSRKERLRKEVMRAREMDSSENTEETSGLEEKESKSTTMSNDDENGYGGAVEMEVDTSYNEETQADSWDEQVFAVIDGND